MTLVTIAIARDLLIETSNTCKVPRGNHSAVHVSAVTGQLFSVWYAFSDIYGGSRVHDALGFLLRSPVRAGCHLAGQGPSLDRDVNVVSVVDALNLPDLGLIHERGDGRIGGPIGDSNQYAVFITLFLPGPIALAVLERGWIRAAAMLGEVVSTLALALTASRGGVLGLLAYATRYGELLYDRFILQATGGAHDASSGRRFIWTTALAKMFEQPVTLITGYGRYVYRAFRDFGYAPHNHYLGIFFNLGLIGLALVLLTYAGVLRIARQAIGWGDSQQSGLTIAFILGFFGVLVGIFFVKVHTPWLFVWAYTGAFLRLAVTVSQGEQAREAGPLPGRMTLQGRRDVAGRA